MTTWYSDVVRTNKSEDVEQLTTVPITQNIEKIL